MIRVNFIQAFHTKVHGYKIRFIFSYQRFSILKDDEEYHFIPIEGKEILYNLKTQQIENPNETFVFQRGNRFIRIPLYKLEEIHGVKTYIEEAALEKAEKNEVGVDFSNIIGTNIDSEELELLIIQLELKNIDNAIDSIILRGSEEDKCAFNCLVEKRNELKSKSKSKLKWGNSNE